MDNIAGTSPGASGVVMHEQKSTLSLLNADKLGSPSAAVGDVGVAEMGQEASGSRQTRQAIFPYSGYGRYYNGYPYYYPYSYYAYRPYYSYKPIYSYGFPFYLYGWMRFWFDDHYFPLILMWDYYIEPVENKQPYLSESYGQ